MSPSETRSGGKPVVLLGAVALGLFLGEMVIIIARAPGLLAPAHLSGLGSLVISALVLYLAVGIYFILFYVMLRIISFILRLRFTPSGTALIAALTALPFLIVQNSFQTRMLGQFMSLTAPRFYVPSAIVLALLVGVLILLHLVTRRVKEVPAWYRRITDWRALAAIAFVVFVVYASFAVTPINVLGIFTEEQEHNESMEYKAAAVQEAPPDAPNFIVLKIEAFRRDEFTPENAPFLWQLAQDNIWFTDYYVVAPATRASVTSFFTSLYPVQHASYDEPLAGRAGEESYIRSVAVAESIRSVPRQLLEHGYHTIEITSNDATLDRMFGFKDVFNRFDALEPYSFRFPSLDPFEGYRFLKRYTGYWRVFKIIVTSPEHSWTYFDAPRVNETIKRELDKRLNRGAVDPFFLYVHYMEPHSPYYRHPYRALHLNLYSPERREKILGLYRSEIGAVDRSIADLYAFLETKGLLENTYLFISADHGEEFHDHGQWGHGKSVYPEVLKVPAIMVLPPGKRIARHVDQVVENIDVMPTFAELAGVSPWVHWQGESLASHFDPDAATQAPGSRGIAFSQFNDGRRFFWASAVRDGWQVIFREPGRRKASGYEPQHEGRCTMLFNLAEDPLAKHDLYGQGSDVEQDLVDTLNSNLTMLEATSHLFRGKEVEIDQDRIDQLKALGYIQ
jgi:arylsulfatase A-like enzyme